MAMTKAQAGSMGGKTIVKKYGKEYMKHLARRGAAATHQKYRLTPVGTNDFIYVDRVTGKPTGKTINGVVLPVRDSLDLK